VFFLLEIYDKIQILGKGDAPMKSFRAASAALVMIIVCFAASCSTANVPVDTAVNPGNLPSSPGQPSAVPQTPAATSASAEHTVYSEGIYIDGINLKGISQADAKKQIVAKQESRLDAVGVTLQSGDKAWKFTYKDVKCTFNTDEVVKNAWALSERNYLAEQSGDQTPQDAIKLATTLSIDPSTIEDKVRNLAFSFYVPCENSTFAGYNPAKPDGSRLSFTKEKPGRQVDADALWAAVLKEFTNETFGTVPIIYSSVPAKITAKDWQVSMKLVSRFVSVQSNTPARIANVKLACKAISGHFIMPGETFSFNDTTGQRTAAKGYQMAHVINGGVVDNGLAGGTCQVSGTLFNAAARANLTIEERHHHTLRSAYLPMGQDATVDYGHYDLKLKNDSDSPVLVIMYVGTGSAQKNVYAEIYGKPLPKGETIDLYSRLSETVPAPTTVTFATSDAVKPGTTETVKAHVGWKVTTYRQYKRNGKVYKSVVLYKDYYKEAGTIIVYNPADPEPTLPPSPSPAMTPTPTPKPR
jgi:vancomycin resistance protein YoaR